ncbi:Uncharacterised protein [Corynebacterium ulcerans]|uniref:Uncharacterized protein n=2 Tax=Corynebacterium ulcerans TaxID=65058 RepID=A0ABD7MT97_CORUL|nr:Uncharacterised protein [Corynebacterium ulcerans]SQG51359.1 Uncharacterised protein [Corynebacterium ulcerans]SQH02365.1 Uncharacterised protein [Corynebacterium ulcerans]
MAGIDVPHVKFAEVMCERALSTVSGAYYPGLTGVMNTIDSPWGESTALQAKTAKLIDNAALHNPSMASVMSKIASPLRDAAAFQPLVTKVLESYKSPALDMARIGMAGFNVQSFLELQTTAQDILGRTNKSQWPEPLRLAAEYMEMKFSKLLSEEEALSQLGVFKDIDWVVDVADIELDELKTGEDLEDFVEEHEEFIEDLVEKFESDEALRIRAAEVLVEPAIRQLTRREVYILLISTAEYVATQLAALIAFGNLEIMLILFIVASLRYYNEMCTESEELEAKHQERIDECVDGLASK